MGFDNECILNIQSLAGEYFCPVCRLLVVPNEALQSQCTHLYCKPCLAYIANSTKACPYDGYLVTEADSKPLIESNKTLAETINKIPVHCLYHRSGCTWQGPLSECVAHCFGCAFGSSPVVCNRCGTQIVHRQVQEHAQACPGVQPQTQQAGLSQGASAAAKVVTDQSHNANQAGVASTQVQTAQNTVAAPVQDPNQQASAGIQTQTVSQAAVTTSEQWYQQQYSQYYQQYPGYYPYQQQYQQYYPYQQQAVMQPQLYLQSQAQPQPQLQPQPQPQPQTQPQPQVQPQSQPQLQPQTLPPTQVQTQQHVHAVPVPQAQNAQQQVLPVANQQPQNPPSQPAFYPQGQSQAMPQQYPAQSFSQQHMQTQYQQSQVQMQYPNLQNQPQGYPQLQSQPNPNLQSQAQPSAQPLVQASHPQGQQHLPPPPPVANQPAAQPHTQTSHPVTGYHSYPLAQASQQIQLGAPQQTPVNIRPQQPSQQPVQMQGQFSQSSAHVRPPHHGPIPNQQQPGLLPTPAQGPNIPATQQQPMFPYNQQPGNLAQQRPLVPPIQPHMSQQYGQQHQPPSVQQSGPPQSQTYPLTPFGQQQIPVQPQLRSQGPAQSSQLQNAAYPRPQQSVMGSFGSHLSHQSQNLVGRPMVPNQGVLAQAGSVPVKPIEAGYNQNNLISSGGQIAGTSSEQQPDAILHTGRAVSEQQVDTSIRKLDKVDVSSSAGTGTVEMRAVKSQNGSQTGEDRSIEANRSADGTSLERGGLPSYQMGKEASSMKEPTDGRLVETVARDEKFGSTVSPKGQEQQATAPKDKIDGSSDRILRVQDTEFSQGHVVNIQKDIQEKGQQDRNLPHAQSNSFSQRVDNSRGFPPHGQLHMGGVVQSSHSDALVDQGRHQPPMLPYGQSPHQQRPPAPMLQAPPPGPQYGSPGLGQLLPGMRSPSNQFQPPAFNRPPGPETFPGIMPGNGLATSYGRGGQGPQSIPTQGPQIPGHSLSLRNSQDEMGLPPGIVDESNRMRGLKPLHGPEGDLFNKRSLYVDDRSSHTLNSVGSGPLGRPSGVHSDMVTMHRPPGMDPSSMFGHPAERLKSLQNVTVEPLSMEPSRHIRERRGFEEDMKHFGRPHDMDPDPFHRSGRFFPSGSPFNRHPLDKAFYTSGPEGGPGSAAASSRGFPPHSHGNLFGETTFGPSEEDRGRFDSSRMHEPGRACMDSLSSRSPGREYPGFPSCGFGSFSNDIERRELHMPGDPAHFRRGEFEGPGHMRMGDHLRNEDLISRDFTPKNIRRGELLGPRDLPGHMQMGEHGGLHGPAHIGESFGTDLFGSNRMGNSRFGDPRFRSSFYPGDLELADNSRKRKVASMGWCRICNVDCETVEGLDLHSQTREHQRVAMDMVLSIKQQNAKKQKVSSSGKTSVADASKSRTVGAEAFGNKK